MSSMNLFVSEPLILMIVLFGFCKNVLSHASRGFDFFLYLKCSVCNISSRLGKVTIHNLFYSPAQFRYDLIRACFVLDY